ncbi:MAG: methyltransferase domain-containing protein [Elusimicrobia bacterium]|nr:methyltransferase domain-containing protein [Elusimicrobiota bacterium]
MITIRRRGSDVFELFDRMAPHYWLSDALSLGLAGRLRSRAAAALSLDGAGAVCDLMTGGGEAWDALDARLPPGARIVAVDASRGMLINARRRMSRLPGRSIALLDRDALEWDVPEGAFDGVLCCLGAKLVDSGDQERLARQVLRMLRPGGSFSFVELTIPGGRFLPGIFRAFLGRIVPAAARVLTGGEHGFVRLIGYVDALRGGLSPLASAFEGAGAEVRLESLMGGCAQILSGKAP